VLFLHRERNKIMETIKINTETIQLDQLLKWAGIIASGGEVKVLLEDQRIKLNGTIETARRRKLKIGDVVEIDGIGSWKVAGQDE
jgi:ribosome-associated protein